MDLSGSVHRLNPRGDASTTLPGNRPPEWEPEEPMPQILVEYSDNMTDAFDRRGFALALHTLVATMAETALDSCKTRFRPIEEYVIADGAAHHAMVHIEVGLLSGRTAEAKSELARAVLALARDHMKPTPRLTVQTTVDIADLDGDSYQKHVAARSETEKE
ncbi:5-carboxymethyl-2-hydroxymuconate Delta-isomerase [Streptosporangium sp. NPDC000396]|uniref:5-carboxymethyl-2-hydroxymuconate Delta-isomerase n=1 Tax=Streptosporangium sp. NPDC000396 TaxID=3366185 RepID=UPI0036CAC263